MRRIFLLFLCLHFAVQSTEASGGNLVPNASFEIDKDGDGSPDGWWRYAHKQPKVVLKALQVDSERAHTGTKSVRIVVPASEKGMSLCWVTPRFGVEPEQWLYAEVWVMSERLEGRLSFLYWFGTKEGKRITQISRPIAPPAGVGWSKRACLVKVPPDAYIASLDLLVRGKGGTVWFDDLTVEPMKEADVLPSALYKFDFGTGESDVFMGFAGVSDKQTFDEEKGYGWRGAKWGVERIGRLRRDPERRRAPWSPVNPDALCYDFVFARNATFEVALPNGDYELVVICGDINGRPPWGYSIEVQGKSAVTTPALDDESRREWLWMFSEDDWSPDYDVWEKFIAPYFRTHKIKAKVTNGKLRVGFNNCPVNMLAVYPADKSERIAKEMKELTRLRRLFFPYRELRYSHWGKLPELMAEERNKGYIVFVRNYLAEVFPDTLPQRGEIRDELKLTAASNEYESVTFAVRALEDLRDVRVEVSDLVGERGGRIPRREIAVRFVRYIEIAQARAKAYRVCPHILMEHDSTNIPAGTSKWIWLTVHVAKGTPSGEYGGTVTVGPAGKPPTHLRLRLNVLPFELPERVRDRYYAILCNWPPSPSFGDVWELYSQRFPLLKKYGMETLYIAGGPFRVKVELRDGKVEITDMAFLEKTMALYRKAGLSENRVLWNTAFDLRNVARELSGGDEEAYRKIYVALLKEIDSIARRRGFPEIFYMNTATDWATAEEQIPRDELVRSAGVKVWDQQGQPPTIRAVYRLVDLLLIHPPPDEKEKLIAEIRASGREVGFHNHALSLFFSSRLHEAPMIGGAYRFLWGFWFWRTGAQVMGDEFFVAPSYGQPYNPFDGVPAEPCINDTSGVASRGLPSPRPHIRLAWMREGRDDYRYIDLLQQLISEAMRSGSVEAKQRAEKARAFLDELARSINIEDYHARWDWRKCPWWEIGKYDLVRSEIARHIIAIMESLR